MENDDKLISVNLYQGDDNLPINAYEDGTNCNPYLITFRNELLELSDNCSLNENCVFPACTLWNASSQTWNENECFVYDINENDNSVTCGCLKLRTHRIISEEFIPIANVKPVWNWREITTENVHKYPTVLITIFIICAIVIFMGTGGKYVDKTVNRPILAYEDVIFIKTRDERMKNDIVGKEIAFIQKYLPNEALIGQGLKILMMGSKAKRSLFTLNFK